MSLAVTCLLASLEKLAPSPLGSLCEDMRLSWKGAILSSHIFVKQIPGSGQDTSRRMS